MKKFLAAMLLFAIVAVAPAIIVGTRTFEGIVEEHPYERGLEWDRTQKERRESGVVLSLAASSFHTGPNAVEIRITDALGNPLSGLAGRVVVSRPSTTKYDRSYALSPSSPGLYAFVAEIPAEGQWDLHIFLKLKGKEIGFDQTIRAEREGNEPSSEAAPSACVIQSGPCTTSHAGQTASLDINPRPFAAMKPLDFVLTLNPGPLPDRLIVDLSMPGMYMGINRIALRKGSDNTFRGRGFVPRCPVGNRRWEARIEVPGMDAAVFAFDVED